MGCISSKHVIASANSPLHGPAVVIHENYNDYSSFHDLNSNPNPNPNYNFRQLEKIREETDDDEEGSGGGTHVGVNDGGVESLNSYSSNKNSKKSAFTFSVRFGRSTEAEHVAAGWPAWLSAVAGEAIDGWLPLKSDNFERLEKIGQGTYSSVYRAREFGSGRMMALKKVRFDNFQPESVRFMAREIMILRRLDHPNIMKLEGIITSRLSCSIYFVFEYMEHDLSGLLSCPDIKFTDSQIKCYMWQLLNGVDHCHTRGILHRDIKAANILVNNEGCLKLADFGLANFLTSKSKQPLTSRVVTLWYRPPELLLGCTNYGTYIDMWSVGCVFAELFFGRPILKGRTEVEQLHKIFMLCGTPPEEYWRTSKLPLATMFKPQQDYESTLRERCQELPKTAVNQIEILLSVEPHKRGTAASALESEYFTTKPYACDPASLPKYPPNKEIDAKFREEARRRKAGGRLRASGASRNLRRVRKTLPEQTIHQVLQPEIGANAHIGHGNNGFHPSRASGSSKASYDTVSEVSQTTEVSQVDSICTLPAQATAPSGRFTYATKRRKHVAFATPTVQNVAVRVRDASPSPQTLGSGEFKRSASSRPDAFHSSEVYKSQDLSSDYNEQERSRYSGHMLIQSHKIEGRQESSTRNVGRSRFYRDAEL